MVICDSGLFLAVFENLNLARWLLKRKTFLDNFFFSGIFDIRLTAKFYFCFFSHYFSATVFLFFRSSYHLRLSKDSDLGTFSISAFLYRQSTSYKSPRYRVITCVELLVWNNNASFLEHKSILKNS